MKSRMSDWEQLHNCDAYIYRESLKVMITAGTSKLLRVKDNRIDSLKNMLTCRNHQASFRVESRYMNGNFWYMTGIYIVQKACFETTCISNQAASCKAEAQSSSS